MLSVSAVKESSSYMLLLEELLSSPHQMMVHSAVEASHKVEARDRLGGFEAGGFSFFLSNIVKVIDVKQTETGVLLRVQSEGRVAVKSLDVQNLSNKFKGPETSNLQRAMQWVDNPQPLVFASSSLMLNSRPSSGAAPSGLRTPPTGSFASGSYDAEDFQPSKILANQIQPDVDSIFTESISGSISDSESDAQYAAAASTGAAGASSGAASTASGTGSGSGNGGSGPSPSSSSAGLPGPGGVIRTRPSLLDLERACRLSMAAIQILPRTTEEERAAVRAAQTEALETQDVLQRLHLANRVMAEARGLLSAKCALLTLSSASPGS
eukprot:XP_001699171.1 predicted protein [Chlamydomonas reinhardtii]